MSFVVDGIPQGQGSKVANRFGGFREANPNTRPWRAAIASAAMEAMDGQDTFAGPVYVTANFSFPRPKAHYGSGKNAATLKPSAPDYVTRKPDLDKLARALCDAMTGIVFRDDSQVAVMELTKRYDHPGVQVFVWELDHEPVRITVAEMLGLRAAETAA